MFRMNRLARFLIVASLAMAFSGCPKKATEDLSQGVKGQADWSSFKKQPDVKPGEKGKDVKPEPPKKKELPDVHLDELLKATCRVNRGDAMPEATLADVAGKPVPLRSLFGAKATVLLFWSGEDGYTKAPLRKLPVDVLEPFGAKGVAAVGVSVKDKPEAARKAVEEAGVKYANLVDPDGVYFAKVATKKLPRVYLLDAAGKVVWFDVEYSPTTRRDLAQAIEIVLEKKP